MKPTRARAPLALRGPLALALTLALAASAPRLASAEEPDVTHARDLFVRGGELVKQAQWAEALAAFEESARLRPHAVTSYDVGACHRAMGHYTRARAAFTAALAEGDKAHELTPALTTEIKDDLRDIERLLVHLTLTASPSGARVTVDGAAPAREPDGRVLLDPGAHVVVVSLAGWSDAVRSETFAPGSEPAIDVHLESLPATLRVGASQPRAQVTVDDADVGLTPLEITRPAGSYRVSVRKKGFVSYDVDAALRPGQRLDLAAKLAEERPSILQRWWFWSAAAVVVAGASVATYVLTRPEPERPPLDGGGLGWTVKSP